MGSKKPILDPVTVAVAQRVLAMPPKHNADLKVGRKKKRSVKDRAASSKPRNA